MSVRNFNIEALVSPSALLCHASFITSKNYRLKAYIKVDVSPDGLFGFSQGKSYDVDYVFWPNGGKTYFEECEVIPTKDINECLDNDFREWRVEVQKEPEVPASIYDDPS